MPVQHINQKPLVVGATTTHAEAALSPATFADRDGLYIYNPDTSNACFVQTGKSPVADTTCNFVPPASWRLFKKSPDSEKISVKMAGGSGVNISVFPASSSDGLN